MTMTSEPLDRIPLWGLALATCVVAWVALEAGFRLGRWRYAHAAQEKEGPIGTMVGSILALLAFMLAFTYSLAGARFDARRQTVLDEANAIGTTYLRARLLPEPQRTEVARLLRQYVDARLPDGRQGMTAPAIADAVARSEQLHEALWSQAVAAAERNPTPITGLFVLSLNEMIDLHARRVLVGRRSRIPLVIWIGLFLLAILSIASMGYQAGLSAMRRSPAMLGLILAFAGVLLLIADLDRPTEGSLTTSQEAMVDLQRSMRTGQP
jgi:hypothetical protein